MDYHPSAEGPRATASERKCKDTTLFISEPPTGHKKHRDRLLQWFHYGYVGCVYRCLICNTRCHHFDLKICTSIGRLRRIAKSRKETVLSASSGWLQRIPFTHAGEAELFFFPKTIQTEIALPTIIQHPAQTFAAVHVSIAPNNFSRNRVTNQV